jgi:hypothetical protein
MAALYQSYFKFVFTRAVWSARGRKPNCYNRTVRSQAISHHMENNKNVKMENVDTCAAKKVRSQTEYDMKLAMVSISSNQF